MSDLGRVRAGLLAPQSLAIIGASDDPDKTTGRPLAYLRRAGWAGRIYPVNPTRATVQGERAWASLAELPEAPDHALILTPKAAVREALTACARAGVKAASVLATGFAEVGEAGRAAQEELAQIARAGGLRLLGPSSLGFADPRTGLILTANAAFADPDLPSGRTFAASHSGSMMGALASRGAAKGLGFAGIVSVGVEADLSLGEICLAALDDPDIDSFLLFLESLRHADDLRRFAVAADAAGKPVIAYKLGRSAQAAEMARSHTGALAGEDIVASAFFDACGIIRVDTLDGLLEAPAFALRMRQEPHKRRPAVGVVGTTGGGAALVVDRLGIQGVDVQPPSADTWSRLAAAGVDAEPGRVVDLTLAGTRYEVMKAALETMTSAPEFDLVVAVAGSSARFQPQLAVQPAADVAPVARKPLAVFATPEAPDALRRLAEAGVPAFRTPESCADVIAATLRRRPARSWVGGGLPATTEGRFIDEALAYERIGVRASPFRVVNVGEAPCIELRYPVAVKALSAALPHKTDAGGVVLNVRDDAGVASASRRVVESVARAQPGTVIDRVLVQEMAQGVGEVLVGFRRDPEVGPIVVLAPGGVLAELGGERALRLAPVDEAEAREMIDALPALKALAGYRSRPAGDLKALAQAISKLSALASDPEVLEAEVNPLIVLPVGEGVVAVDALVRVAEEERR